jgi:three-Cys-motif partner protein
VSGGRKSEVEQPSLFTELQPQSATKHDILAKYISAWGQILSKQDWCEDAWVVDGFAGPGRYGDGSPGSPLLLADAILRWQQARSVDRPRFRFHLRLVERDHRAELERAISSVSDDLDIQICAESTFREALPRLVEQIGNDPAFYFIDPAGWAGAEFDLVEQAIAGRSKEILINFMYDRLNEFAGVARQVSEGSADARVKGIADGITRFFGTSEWIDVILDDPGPRVREAQLLHLYADQLRKRDAFAWSFRNKYAAKNRTYYYLIHATRSLTGLKIMKELMINADMAEPTLFDEIDFQAGVAKFKRELQLRFGGGAPTPEREVLAYVLQDTEYLPKQMERALVDLGALLEEGRSGSRRIRNWRIPSG